MRARSTFFVLQAGLVAMTLAVPAYAQVGGGNDLPGSATQPSGAGGTANTPQNNGIGTSGSGGATSGGSMSKSGGAMSKGGAMGDGSTGAGGK